MIIKGTRYDLKYSDIEEPSGKHNKIEVLLTPNPKIRIVVLASRVKYQSIGVYGISSFENLVYTVHLCSKKRGTKNAYKTIECMTSHTLDRVIERLEEMQLPGHITKALNFLKSRQQLVNIINKD